MGWWARAKVNHPSKNPMHWVNRGWDASVNHAGGRREDFDLPIPLLFTAASGLDEPVFLDDGSTLLNPAGIHVHRLCPVFAWRGHWVAASVSSYSKNDDISGYCIECDYCRPVRPLPKARGDMSGRRMDLMVLRSPFPLTVDTRLTVFSTCSLGHTDDPPSMPPYNGRPSRAMAELMNRFRMKPGYIVWNGYLHVWVNWLYWRGMPDADDDLRYCMTGVPATLELELFKAYKAYYQQLQQELPNPYCGPVRWPDQCDPRFPLPGDPRVVNYITQAAA